MRLTRTCDAARGSPRVSPDPLCLFWPFRHDGVRLPRSRCPATSDRGAHLALLLDDKAELLVVDWMAGGGSTLDVCESMGHHCVAYGPSTPHVPGIQKHNIRKGFPREANGSDLIFCDPPYRTIRARCYGDGGVDTIPLAGWIAFLDTFHQTALTTLRGGGYIAILFTARPRIWVPAGWGLLLDHVSVGYHALPCRGWLARASDQLPDGRSLPAAVRPAAPRAEGRMLGQVRDLIIMRLNHSKVVIYNMGSPQASS